MSDLKKILVVDDSALSRMMIRSLVQARYPDCVVVEAGSGDEALSKTEEGSGFDLITLDINMPGMNSFDAAVQLHKQFPAASMAVITANIQQSIRKKIQSLGILFLAVIDKPVTEDSMQQIFDAL